MGGKENKMSSGKAKKLARQEELKAEKQLKELVKVASADSPLYGLAPAFLSYTR